MTTTLTGADIGARLTRLRQAAPLVHSLTNYVAMNSADQIWMVWP